MPSPSLKGDSANWAPSFGHPGCFCLPWMPTVSPVPASLPVILIYQSHSLQSISCLTNGNWGPEVVLKFIFSKPQRGGGHLSYPLWPRYFQTFPGSRLSWETILGCLLWHMFLNIPATGQHWARHLSCFISSSQTSLKQAKSFSHT